MKTMLTLFYVITIGSMLSGCVANKIAVRPETMANIHNIALINIEEPQGYVANDLGNPGAMFGAIGGVAVAMSSADAAKMAAKFADEVNFKPGELFTSLLKEKLSSKGYRINLISVSREKKIALLKNYDTVDSEGADAILDVAIESIGWETEHPMTSPHWRPSSQIHVALVDVHKKSIIYTEKFMYGYHNPLMTGTDLDAPEMYHIQKNDELYADITKWVDGMRHSVNTVVNQIVFNLSK